MINFDTLLDGPWLGFPESHDSDEIVGGRGILLSDFLQGCARDRGHVPPCTVLHVGTEFLVEDVLSELHDVEGGDIVAAQLWKLDAGDYHTILRGAKVHRIMSCPAEIHLGTGPFADETDQSSACLILRG